MRGLDRVPRPGGQRARVRGLLAQADLFALPCREDSSGDRDGIPVVLMEAMACGVPVVSGDLPAIRELVRPNDTGVLVDGTKFQDLAAEVDRLVGSPRTREILARNAREHVSREFSMTTNVERLIQKILISADAGQVAPPVARLTSASPAGKRRSRASLRTDKIARIPLWIQPLSDARPQ